jgi:hypothetical protein
MNILKPWLPCVCLLAFSACAGQQTQYRSPEGYDLARPEKYVMPDVLHEISGICFYEGNSDTLYTEQDEEGKVYSLRLGDKGVATLLGSAKFGKKGDFEDITILDGIVIMLRSDGVLFSFPFNGMHGIEGKEEIPGTRKWEGLLPPGEYEGVYGDRATRSVYVLCKHCGGEAVKSSEHGDAGQVTGVRAGGYIFSLGADGSLSPAGDFKIKTKGLEGESDRGFHPSALAKDERTDEWYILSSVNKLLVVADARWQVKGVYPLNPVVFNQPEGITFDKGHNLYISNEGGHGGSGDVLKFMYHPK